MNTRTCPWCGNAFDHRSSGAKRPYPTWQRRHEAILCWLLEHPGGKLYACAAATGYSASQVSRIVNSPDFRRRFTHALEAGRREAYLRGMFGLKSTARDGG